MKQGQKARIILWGIAILLIALIFLGASMDKAALEVNFAAKNQSPGAQYFFGTDWMGRDLFARTMSGLSRSLRLGLCTAFVSACIALLMGALAAMGGKVADGAVSWVIDLAMGIPHLLLLVLISFACGRGMRGLVVAIITTHWMSLARVLRGEILQLRQSGYVQVARKLGKNKLEIFRLHLLPHLLPQYIAGLVLLFPHIILHEASVTFLGFGLPAELPSVGTILAESIRHLTVGGWWLGVFPGLLLVCCVLLFALAGHCVQELYGLSGGEENAG